MELFAVPDGQIDRFLRAFWITPPFDQAFGEPVPISPPVLRLFGGLSGRVDNLDRAGWITTPFTLLFGGQISPIIPVGPYDGPLCISWALGAVDTAEVELFWATVCRLGIAANQTLAQLLDLRPQPPATPVTPLSLPVDINPLGFLAAEVLRGQSEVVLVKAGSIGPNRLDYLAGPLLRRVVPPHTLLLVQLQMPIIDDNQEGQPGVDNPSVPVPAMAEIFDTGEAWMPPANDTIGLVVAPMWSA